MANRAYPTCYGPATPYARTGGRNLRLCRLLMRGANVETAWDWITVFTFAGLATLLLQRSAEEEPRDHLWQYAPPAVGCALVNYVGNEGYHAPAAVIFVAVVAYIFKVLNVPIPFVKP